MHAFPAPEASARPVPMTAFERRFHHPPGLVVLFFAEMWERFSYYGMRGLLKLYMANYLFVSAREVLQGCRQKTPPCELAPGDPSSVLFWENVRGLLPASATPEEAASVLYGAYVGLVYATPFFGGILADRFLGQRRAVIVGAVLMAIGHFVMAVESAFFVALALLILGNGAFKPNVSTQVGSLYAPGDPRRDGAFTIFYMGINLGAFVCNLVCGTLAALYGWHYGFAAAGVGMLLGLLVYIGGQKYLAPDQLAQRRAAGSAERKPLDARERNAVWALVALCALNVVFWAVYEQQGNTMQTVADERTTWPTVFGFQIPSTWYQSVNPLGIIVMAPVLDVFWRYQARRGTEPTSITKMAIGCILLGVSFVLLIVGSELLGGDRVGLFWLLSCTVLLTLGELYLSPIGLSLVTKVSPARIVSMMMGVWFLSSFLGGILSGAIGVLYTRWSSLAFFSLLTALGVGSGLCMLAFNRPLREAIGKH